MALSAQDKILHVASKLGLTTLGQMQGSTGAVYDVDIEGSGFIFNNASQHAQPGITNINENKFEVNEALLIESIAFYGIQLTGPLENGVQNLLAFVPVSSVIVFDLIIGNKRVMKDTPVFAAGQPSTFATNALQFAGPVLIDPSSVGTQIAPRHQIFMEGAGILIPPQIEWSINFKLFDLQSGAQLPLDGSAIGAYLFGTRVLLNFNTTI